MRQPQPMREPPPMCDPLLRVVLPSSNRSSANVLANASATLPAALQHAIVSLSALSHSSFARQEDVSKTRGYQFTSANVPASANVRASPNVRSTAWSCLAFASTDCRPVSLPMLRVVQMLTNAFATLPPALQHEIVLLSARAAGQFFAHPSTPHSFEFEKTVPHSARAASDLT